MECSKSPLGHYALLVIKSNLWYLAGEHSAPGVFWSTPFFWINSVQTHNYLCSLLITIICIKVWQTSRETISQHHCKTHQEPSSLPMHSGDSRMENQWVTSTHSLAVPSTNPECWWFCYCSYMYRHIEKLQDDINSVAEWISVSHLCFNVKQVQIHGHNKLEGKSPHCKATGSQILAFQCDRVLTCSI